MAAFKQSGDEAVGKALLAKPGAFARIGQRDAGAAFATRVPAAIPNARLVGGCDPA